MIKLVEVRVHEDDKTPKSHYATLFVNPEDVSHLYRNGTTNQSFISFRNGKEYRIFSDVETVTRSLQSK